MKYSSLTIYVWLCFLYTPVNHAVELSCIDLLNEQHTVYDSWSELDKTAWPGQENPDFLKDMTYDGSKRMPPGLGLSVEVISDGVSQMHTFGSGSVSNQSIFVQNFFRRIQSKSNPGDLELEREYGGAVVVLNDGRFFTIEWTSNELTHLSTQSFIKEFQRVMDELEGIVNYSSIKKIVHIHTHPDLRSRNGHNPAFHLLPSDNDYRVLTQLKDWFLDKEYTGVILPTSENNMDTFLIYNSEGLGEPSTSANTSP